jgi:hypothetical protein
MRFVVPVPTVYARPNRKYFGPKRELTWLNMINDQAAGLGAKVDLARIRRHWPDVLRVVASVYTGTVSAWGAEPRTPPLNCGFVAARGSVP